MTHTTDVSCIPTPEDTLDAAAFIWLIRESNSTESARSSALQAIAGLPRDFTAYQLLRQAGAIEMILERFESCFQLDTTLGNQWCIKDPHAAEKYCRGWLRLTYQTKIKWPTRLLQPLYMLRDLPRHPAVNVTAACILALTSLEEYSPQDGLLSFLSRHVNEEVRLSWSAQQEILDTLLECIALWELSAAAIAEIVFRAVPILIRLLHRLGNTGPPTLRHAISFNLYALTGNFVDQGVRRDGDKRKDMYWDASIKALSEVALKRACYGVEGEGLLGIVALELARVANVLVTKPQKFPQSLYDSAKAAFTSLYLEGHIITRDVPEDTLANVLYLLHPPTLPEPERQAVFTHHLIDTLRHSKQQNTICNTLRLLDAHLASYSLPAMKAFMRGGGLEMLLHIANTRSIDGRRLQMDSLRALCTFVNASATLYLEDGDNFDPSYFDTVFQSDFLKTLCAVIAAGGWWLTDVAHVWAPALVKLCRVRPGHDSWRKVERTFWKYADLHQTEYGQRVLLSNLQCIRELRRELEGGKGKSFFEEDF